MRRGAARFRSTPKLTQAGATSPGHRPPCDGAAGGQRLPAVVRSTAVPQPLQGQKLYNLLQHRPLHLLGRHGGAEGKGRQRSPSVPLPLAVDLYGGTTLTPRSRRSDLPQEPPPPARDDPRRDLPEVRGQHHMSRTAKHPRMTTAAADALLAVQPVTRDDGQRATQALRSLFADGWTIQQLADTTGLTARTVGRTINGHTTPAPSSAAAIIEALDQLRFEDPGDSVASLQARYRGERAGWEPVTRPHPGPTSTTSPSHPTTSGRAACRAATPCWPVPRQRDRPSPRRVSPDRAASPPQPRAACLPAGRPQRGSRPMTIASGLRPDPSGPECVVLDGGPRSRGVELPSRLGHPTRVCDGDGPQRPRC